MIVSITPMSTFSFFILHVKVYEIRMEDTHKCIMPSSLLIQLDLSDYINGKLREQLGTMKIYLELKYQLEC